MVLRKCGDVLGWFCLEMEGEKKVGKFPSIVEKEEREWKSLLDRCSIKFDLFDLVKWKMESV